MVSAIFRQLFLTNLLRFADRAIITNKLFARVQIFILIDVFVMVLANVGEKVQHLSVLRRQLPALALGVS